MSELRGKISELDKLHDQAVLDKARAVLHHHKQIDGTRNARQALLEAQVLLLEAESDVAILKDRNSEITQQLEEGKRSLQEITREVAELREATVQALKEAESVMAPEKDDSLSVKAVGQTVELVDQAISVERAKLEVIHASNPAALEEYERYAAKIERERANQANQESKLAELNERIKHIKGQWEPRLDRLVGQINEAFSYNFEQISCAGEVGVHKDEDFDKWAIEVKVKFR
jgi:chromosome segregation ATPase